jgi:hypothetical protein
MNEEKVKQALALYADGAPIASALFDAGLSQSIFYDVLAFNPSLETRYHELQRRRADIAVSKCYSIVEGEISDALKTRVRVNTLIKLAGFWDRRRYGEKTTVSHDVGPDLLAALTAARSRALPARDLALIEDAQYTPIPNNTAAETTDKQSVAKAVFDD